MRGSSVARVVCGLVGAASGLAGLHIYLASYEFADAPSIGAGLKKANGVSLAASPDASIFVGASSSIAIGCGLLITLAAAVYLLAPHREAAH